MLYIDLHMDKKSKNANVNIFQLTRIYDIARSVSCDIHVFASWDEINNLHVISYQYIPEISTYP